MKPETIDRRWEIPDPLPPEIALFMSLVDELEISDKFPTTGIGVKGGKLVLMLGAVYGSATAYEKLELLRHEAAHFYFRHVPRKEDRDPTLWNVVADASLYNAGAADPEICRSASARHLNTDKTQIVVPTFEFLQITPMPAEPAYELLKQKAEEPGCQGCESVALAQDLGDVGNVKGVEARARLSVEAPEYAKKLTARAGLGDGTRSPIDNLPPTPKWIQDIVPWLRKIRARDKRRRSFRRENRAYPLLPGRVRGDAVAAQIMIDASGSIGPELNQFLSAVFGCQELRNSEVYVYDTKVLGPFRAKDRAAINEALTKLGGGTLFGPPALKRIPGTSVVWLTDGYLADSWPSPHKGEEVWGITSDVVPPTGRRVQVGTA